MSAAAPGLGDRTVPIPAVAGHGDRGDNPMGLQGPVDGLPVDPMLLGDLGCRREPARPGTPRRPQRRRASPSCPPGGPPPSLPRRPAPSPKRKPPNRRPAPARQAHHDHSGPARCPADAGQPVHPLHPGRGQPMVNDPGGSGLQLLLLPAAEASRSTATRRVGPGRDATGVRLVPRADPGPGPPGRGVLFGAVPGGPAPAPAHGRPRGSRRARQAAVLELLREENDPLVEPGQRAPVQAGRPLLRSSRSVCSYTRSWASWSRDFLDDFLSLAEL